MTGYGLIGLLIVSLVLILALDLTPAIQQLVQRLVDIPPLTHKSSNPAIFDLAVRLAYLIVFVAVVKIILGRRSDRDD